MPPLENLKHEKFCVGVATGLSQAEAYRRAGYKVRTGPSAVAAASRLLTVVSVMDRLDELRKIAVAEALDAVGVTILALCKKVSQGMQAKKLVGEEEVEDWAAQAKFTDMAFKARGLFETNINVTHELNERKVSPDRAEALAEIAHLDAPKTVTNGRNAKH